MSASWCGRAQHDDIDACSMLVRGSIRTRSTGSPHAWWGGDAAEDLAQDAFLKAWQEIGHVAGEARSEPGSIASRPISVSITCG